MTKEGFLKNNRGINDGADIAPEFMGALYDRIAGNEIKLKDDALALAAAGHKEENKARMDVP
jgi:brefeldin A-inhibited guanine nucleotide-exchange protein